VQIATRRQFLYGIAGLGAAIGFGAGHRLWLADGDPEGPRDRLGRPETASLRSATRSSRAFGTTVSILAWHSDERSAREALDAAFAELELVEQLMSIYRNDSELRRLNRHGTLESPHPYLVEVLRAAQAMSQRSNGAFDITVQPLWELFAEAKRSNALPSPSDVERARQQVDWRRVRVADDRIRLTGGARITLNGIAQGYATDRAAAALRAAGVAHALVDAGEIGALGDKPAGEPWTVGIQHPRREDAYLSLARLNGRCLATSGDYATTFSGDFRFNHLFDPKTGVSPIELASVSVATNTAMQADALSTAVFVLGPKKGIALMSETPGADALLMLKDGRTMATKGFPLQT
jgi:FAD:protein FMN transferase